MERLYVDIGALRVHQKFTKTQNKYIFSRLLLKSSIINSQLTQQEGRGKRETSLVSFV